MLKNKYSYLFKLGAIILFLYFSFISLRNYAKGKSKIEYESMTTDNPKFIVYTCTNEEHECGGWGDRLKGMLSAYVWSLITDRFLLIYINKPCDISNLLQPSEIEWNRPIETFYECSRPDIQLRELMQSREPCKNKRPNIFTLKLYENNKFKKDLEKLNLLEYNKDKDVIFLSALNRNLLPSMAKNEHIKRRLDQLGLDPQKLDIHYLFKSFYDKLFRLAPHMERKHEQFLSKAKPTPATKLVCLQIRLGNKPLNHRTDLKFMASNDTLYFWSFAKSIVKDLSANGNDYRIFLTTDTELVEVEARKELDASKIVTNDGLILHMDRNDLKNDKNNNKKSSENCESIEKSVLDFHSLRNCDIALLSGSQFGTFGLWNRDNPIEGIYCFRANSKKFENYTDMDHVEVWP
jgi:hypothetical protein